MSRISRVQPHLSAPVTLFCASCGKRMRVEPRQSRRRGDEVFADLMGRPFIDYYCAPCAARES